MSTLYCQIYWPCDKGRDAGQQTPLKPLCINMSVQVSIRICYICYMQARSQPARWGGGGLNLDGWNTRRTPPLDIVRVTSSIWKTPPLLDIHRHPPLDIARVTSSTYSKGGTKLLKGGTKLLKGGTKLLKGGTKLLKGGTKSFGWATGGGGLSDPPPDPPPPWLRACYMLCDMLSGW